MLSAWEAAASPQGAGSGSGAGAGAGSGLGPWSWVRVAAPLTSRAAARSPYSRPSPCRRPRRRRRRRTTPSDSPSGPGCCPRGQAESTSYPRSWRRSTLTTSTRALGFLAVWRHDRTLARGGRHSACTSIGTSCRCVRSTGPAAMARWEGLCRLGGARPAHVHGHSQAPRAAAGTAPSGISDPARSATMLRTMRCTPAGRCRCWLTCVARDVGRGDSSRLRLGRAVSAHRGRKGGLKNEIIRTSKRTQLNKE